MMRKDTEEWSRCCGKRQSQRSEDGEEAADVGGLLATRGHGDIYAWATAMGHV